MKRFLIVFLLLLSFVVTDAREGMWIPALLDKYNIEEMQQMGFKLSADDVYSINHNSMKDAVVLFGSGCTGELVSHDGLLLTNHHCGYSSIQSHSSVEHDYLTDGFWAASREQELSNPGLKVRFLDRMNDVTDSVLAGTEGLKNEAFEGKIKDNIKTIEEAASFNGKYEAVVKPLFYGNQYFVYVYKVFKDIRLVGAPPSSIGKFGGDTDNWMWPRHTGDFSVFRVYADKNNEPAEYSPDNVPYHPKSFFPISLKGISPDDFIMVFGFPGKTEEYLPSEAVDLVMNQRDPERVGIRTQKLEILARHMASDPKVRIQYASKYAGTSNSWKRWQGEVRGLKQMDALSGKQSFEDLFRQWYEKDDSLTSLYGNIFPQFKKLYADLAPYSRAYDYYNEIVFRGTDIFSLVNTFSFLADKENEKQLEKLRDDLTKRVREFFKDYDRSTDEEVFVRLMRLIQANLDPLFLPFDFQKIMRSYDDEGLLNKIYRKSVFSDEGKMENIAKGMDEKEFRKLQHDPLMVFYNDLLGHYQRNIGGIYFDLQEEIGEVQKDYMAGIMSMRKGELIYPDANLTLRVAYGKVGGYKPADGIIYRYQTTISGIMGKDNPEIYDYHVPEKLHELYNKKDYGIYTGRQDELPVAFIASVHTTGGNSGSPAINASGELVGINFDRCWEGTMSDIMFDPDHCRNIMVDIRYVLFVIDKFAGAGYLLNEMNLID